MKERETRRILAALLIVNLLLTVGIIGFMVWERQSPRQEIAGQALEPSEKYTLYIGTNDKDTYTQLIPTEEARKIVDEICAKHTDGYTAMDAQGSWVDETGTVTKENSLVYSFYNISEEQVVAIMDDVLTALNQNSILVERETVQSIYYSKGR